MATQTSEQPSSVQPSQSPIPTRRRFFRRPLSTSSIDDRSAQLPRYSFLGTGASEVDKVDALHAASVDSNGGGPSTSTEAAPGGNNTINAVNDKEIILAPPSYDSALPPQPRYSAIFGGGHHLKNPAETHAEVSHIEHPYDIRSGFKNKQWATFRVFSRPFGDPQKLQKFPWFFGGDDIKGVVEFNLDTPQTVHSIAVTLRGRIVTGYLDGDTFLNYRVSVWNRASGDPRSLDPSPAKQFDGKLSGSYEFPFCFSFPTHVDLSTTHPISFASTSSASGPLLVSTTSTTTSPISPISPPSPSSPRSISFFPSLKSPRASEPKPSSPEQSPTSPSGSSHSFIRRSRRNKSVDHTHTIQIPETVQEDPIAIERARAQAHARLESPAPPALQGGRLPENVSPPPQTFLERGIAVNVQYELALVITHGMFTPDSKVKTLITYTPSLKPAFPSAVRQGGTPLSRPDADPEGWYALPKTVIQGELLGERKVELGCTLSLAKPLCYARGTVIPCHLTITSADTNVLDLLAIPKSAPLVRLMRRIRYRADTSAGPNSQEPLGTYNAGVNGGVVPMPASRSHKRRASDPGIQNSVSGGGAGMTEVVEEMGVATWSLKTKQDAEGSFRVLEGEITLGKEMQPSCGFPLFSVQYTVDMLTFVSKLFEPNRQLFRAALDYETDPRTRILLSQPVEIATFPYEANASTEQASSNSS